MLIIANSVIVKHYVNRVRLLYYYIIPTAVPYSLNCPNLNVGKLRAVRTHAANTGYSPNAVSTLAHRLRRWPNIETASGESPVFAEETSRR